IDGAKLFQHPGKHRLDFIFPTDIGANRQRPTATGFDAFYHALGFFRMRDVIYQHIRTGSPEREGTRLTDSGVGAGDERFLIFERLERIQRGIHDG
ncbi:MAG: hypothetical protein QOD99_2590, partial [Chthoniobacter sp.]|nr:hypothetical protein [Chthoniobacter sp.]